MSLPLSRLRRDGRQNIGGKIIAVYLGLIAVNVGAWLWALAAFRDYPVLLGTAFLAYTFGLRHAFDADHIAAIDNVTRKLMQEGKRPVAVGFFFSIGHSTIVLGMSIGIAFAAAAVQHGVQAFQEIGGVISTCVSAFFLFTIAALNFLILISVYRTFRAVRNGKPFVEEDLYMLLNNRGLLARIFRPLFGKVTRSWHLLP